MKIKEIINLSLDFLIKLGFTKEEAELINQNIIDAELSGRKTHGLVRLLSFKKLAYGKKINTGPLKLDVISETATSLYINGHYKLGYGIIYKSLDLAFKKIKFSKIVSVGLKDLGITGYIGAYAKKAIEKDLIFIGFNNSSGGLVPYGSKKELWGTNPLTIGIPTNDIPVILDMASTLTTWGELLIAKNEGRKIKSGVAIDKEGNPTTNPIEAMAGGLLPFAGHKGSGLGFIVELLGGALTGSRVGYAVNGGWGSFYVLIDPTLFRSLKDFKRDISVAISELKNSPKMEGFSEIYFPGEQSYKKKQKCIDEGKIEINTNIFKQIRNFLTQ